MNYEKIEVSDRKLTEDQCNAFRRIPGSFNHMVQEIFDAGVEFSQKQPTNEKVDLPVAPSAKILLQQLLEAVEAGDLELSRRLAEVVRLKLSAQPVEKTQLHQPRNYGADTSKAPF